MIRARERGPLPKLSDRLAYFSILRSAAATQFRPSIRLMMHSHLPDARRRSSVEVVKDASGRSEILTDGWRGYNALGDHGYTRTKTVLSDTADPAHVAMPGVHRIAALLKRWLLGTHQGGVSAKHLDYYLDEYTFRFNRRSSRARQLLFHRLMEQAATTGPTRYRDLVGGNHNG